MKKFFFSPPAARSPAGPRLRAGWPPPSPQRSCWPVCRSWPTCVRSMQCSFSTLIPQMSALRNGRRSCAASGENYAAYDGFVIAHGTDTMAYTAAALSYMIQNSAKPVVLTGSQKSIYNRDTDARNNLYRAFVYAVSEGAWGVQLVFDNKGHSGHPRPQDADPQLLTPSQASTTRRLPFSATQGLSPSCGGRPTCRPFSFMSSSTPLSLCCGWCRVCGQILSRCWPRTTVRLCWKASAWAVCRAVSRAKCLPNCAAGATADGWPCLRPKSRMRGCDLAVYEVGRAVGELPGVLEAHDMTPRGRGRQADGRWARHRTVPRSCACLKPRWRSILFKLLLLFLITRLGRCLLGLRPFALPKSML